MVKKESDNIRNYYNDHNMRILIRDYVNGNPRFEKAIECIVNCGRGSFSKILDIGCGIGYSSLLLKTAFPTSTILGLDISDVSIKTARKLFQVEDLRFDCRDFLVEDCSGPYDLIVMIDVYEHFPLQQRRQVHNKLADLLSYDGWLVLTTPTVDHQTFLRDKHPDRLQVIDEDVSEEDLLLLAKETHTTVVRYEKIAVWNTYDYQHFVARRTPDFTKPPQPPEVGPFKRFASKLRLKFIPEKKRERIRKVRQILKIDPVELIENGRIITID